MSLHALMQAETPNCVASGSTGHLHPQVTGRISKGQEMAPSPHTLCEEHRATTPTLRRRNGCLQPHLGLRRQAAHLISSGNCALVTRKLEIPCWWSSFKSRLISGYIMGSPTRDNAQCLTAIPSSKRSALSPGTPENPGKSQVRARCRRSAPLPPPMAL